MSNKVKINQDAVNQIVENLHDALIIRGQQLVPDSTGYVYAGVYMMQTLVSIINDLPVSHQKRIMNHLVDLTELIHWHQSSEFKIHQ